MMIAIESMKTKRTKMKTDIIKMKSNQVSTIPDILDMELEHCKSTLKY